MFSVCVTVSTTRWRIRTPSVKNLEGVQNVLQMATELQEFVMFIQISWAVKQNIYKFLSFFGGFKLKSLADANWVSYVLPVDHHRSKYLIKGRQCRHDQPKTFPTHNIFFDDSQKNFFTCRVQCRWRWLCFQY